MNPHPTPLKFLGPAWFSVVMGLCGLALAWQRAVPLMGELAGAGALVLGGVAALVALVLAGLSLLRWQRYPQALADDLKHPVRHAFAATMPISLILLATVAATLIGPSTPVLAVWMLGSAWQLGVTVWVLGRWLQAGAGKTTPLWPGVTPVLILPVVGNVLAPLAGVALGQPHWAAAQFGVGLLLWPVVLTLLLVRVAVNGAWPERLLPSTFITIAPPSVIGLAAGALDAPLTLVWICWGVAVFFVVWAGTVFQRAINQPFALSFWGLSFPLAAFAALTLRLSASQPGGPMQVLAVAALAAASLVIAALALATLKGLRDGSLLAPEPVAAINPV